MKNFIGSGLLPCMACLCSRSFKQLTQNPSPLIRIASVETMSLLPSPEVIQALLQATNDASRLVRVRVAAGLAELPTEQVPGKDRESLTKANQEYLNMLMVQRDFRLKTKRMVW